MRQNNPVVFKEQNVYLEHGEWGQSEPSGQKDKKAQIAQSLFMIMSLCFSKA